MGASARALELRPDRCPTPARPRRRHPRQPREAAHEGVAHQVLQVLQPPQRILQPLFNVGKFQRIRLKAEPVQFFHIQSDKAGIFL